MNNRVFNRCVHLYLKVDRLEAPIYKRPILFPSKRDLLPMKHDVYTFFLDILDVGLGKPK